MTDRTRPAAVEQPAAAPSGRRAWVGLLATRLLLLTGFLLLWFGVQLDDKLSLRAFVACAYVLTIPFTMQLRTVRWMAEWAHLLFVADILLVTGLVYGIGRTDSDLVLLYPLVILAAGLTTTPRRAMQISVLSVLAYGGLAMLLVSGALGPGNPRSASVSDAVMLRIIALHVAVIVSFGATAVFIAHCGEYVNRSSSQMRQIAEIVFHHIRAGLLLLDSHSRIIMANAGACQLLGRTAASLHGQPLAALTAPTPNPAPDAQAERPAPAPQILQRADGTRFPIAQETVQLMLPADILPGVGGSGPMSVSIMVFIDLTPILTIQYEANLANTIRVMNSAAAEVAHEMRNPLSAISGAIQVINSLEQAVAHGELSCVRRLAVAKPELLAHIMAETDRMNSTIEKLINTAEFTPAAITSQFQPAQDAAKPAVVNPTAVNPT